MVSVVQPFEEDRKINFRTDFMKFYKFVSNLIYELFEAETKFQITLDGQ